VVILETSVFTRQVQDLLSDEEYRKLQAALVGKPTLGPLIRGSRGLRKVRWALPGKGKRGGVRVIYYWAAREEQLFMLLMYPKSERDDLTPSQLRLLRKLVEEQYR
jgi:mRNA-degrading endonuclease RelE of RelBE toxin-antitoxin system